MQCCQGCVDYFYDLCGISSSVSATTASHNIAPTVMLTDTARKAHAAADTITKFFSDGSLSCYITPRITRAHISPMIGLARGGIYMPPPDHVEYIPYSEKIDIGRLIAKVKAALGHYVVSDFNGTFAVPGPYNSSANTVEQVFKDVLNSNSKWNQGISYIRADVAKHPGKSTTHQQFIKFVDEVLTPLVKEALKTAFPKSKSSEDFVTEEVQEPDG